MDRQKGWGVFGGKAGLDRCVRCVCECMTVDKLSNKDGRMSASSRVA